MALPGTVSVASESKAAEPVGKPFEPGIISLRQRPIPNSQTSRTTKSLIPSIPMSQRNFWQNWFFRASVFAIRIPLVSADEGDDFSNNLATDLAPILSLFGEQVTKQYMSQSMTWLENVIFGMAPLGILTAMVGAIRVGGYKWMKAAVGRAQEGKGIVEMELMSSTSADVCEMWDGDRVIRVLGTPSVAQLFYLVPDNTQIAVGAQSTDSNSAREYLLPPLRDNMLKIYDLKTVPKPWLSRTRPQETNRVESNPGPQETNCAESNPGPNLALNLGGHIVSISELYAVAIIGTVLQLGVILFPGLTRLYLKDTLMKDGKQPQKYALPCMATGTVALVIGMILCSHLVQRSTDEQTWEFKKINGYRVEVVWLQKGRVVNDQQFGSYFIPLVRQQPKKSGILSCLFKQRRKNSQHPLRTSHRATEENIQNQAELTLLAIILGLIGFILQFIGLRGLNWTVTIAQLGSAIIMTILRAIIRRNMAYHITSESIETNHELDEAARRIRGCDCWNIVTVANSRVRDPRESTGDDQSQPTASRNGSDQHTSLAHRVFNTRCQLEEHCLWEFQWQRTVDFMAAAIEGTMNFIYMNPDIYKKGNLGKKFQWKLSVQVDNRSPPCLEDVELNLFREDLSNYRGLGPWKAEKSEIRAALGLWMLHFRLESKKHLLKGLSISSDIDRAIDMGKQSPVETYEKWIRRQEKYQVIHHNQPFAEVESAEDRSAAAGGSTYRALVGCLSDAVSNNSDQSLVVVRTDTPLETVCGQIIFSAFMSSVVSQTVESIGGQVLARGGEQWLKASIGLRNTVLDELAINLEETGLATADEAYLCIIPALATNNKLKRHEQSYNAQKLNYKAKEIKACLEGGRFEQAELLLWWLLDDTENEAKGLEVEGKWTESCEAYARLWEACDSIQGADDFAELAEQAMGFFCKWFCKYANINHDDHLQDVLVNAQMDETEKERGEERLKRCRDILMEWKDSESKQRTGAKASAVDSSLIMACIRGDDTAVWNLLRTLSKADVCIDDAHGMTAMHHAAMKNRISVVGLLLRNDKTSELIATKDNNSKTPLDLAIECNAGAVVNLLTFYGAEDKDGRASKLREMAIHNGSFAAVQAGVSENDEHGRTALHWAVWRGSLRTVKFLKGKVKNVDGRDKDGSTALHLAARGGNDSAVRLLVSELRADKEAKTADGSTALHLAARGGNDPTVRLLVSELRADKEAKTADGSTALHFAARGGNDSTVRLLVSEFGLDKEAKTGDGSTALHQAAKFGYFSTVGKLIGIFGANKYHKDVDRKIPIVEAVIWCISEHYSVDYTRLRNDDTYFVIEFNFSRVVHYYVLKFRHDLSDRVLQSALLKYLKTKHFDYYERIFEAFTADERITTDEGNTAGEGSVAGEGNTRVIA